MNSLDRTSSLFLAAIVSLSLGGCAMLTSPGGTLLSQLQNGNSEESDPAAKPEAAQQAVVVELHHAGGLTGRVRVPVKPGMVVQDLLEGSGAIERFDRMTIKVKRFVDKQQAYLPLTAVYNHDRKEVRPLHARGDRIAAEAEGHRPGGGWF